MQKFIAKRQGVKPLDSCTRFGRSSWAVGLGLLLISLVGGTGALAAPVCNEVLGPARAQGATESLVLMKGRPNAIAFADGRRVQYEASIKDPTKPTLIFTPGLYLGVDGRDKKNKLYPLLKKSQANWIVFESSAHFPSVIDNDSKAKSDISTAQLHDELQSVIRLLEVQKPVVVSLSYFASVTAGIANGQDLQVIETSPMGRYDEELGEMATVNESMKTTLQWMPMGSALYANLREQGYLSYWSKLLGAMGFLYPEVLQPKYFQRLVQGYVGLAKAVEGFDLRQVRWQDTKPRVFILAGSEIPARAANQREALRNYVKQTGLVPYVVMMEGAVHYVARTYPAQYLELLEVLAGMREAEGHAGLRFGLDGKWHRLSQTEILQMIAN